MAGLPNGISSTNGQHTEGKIFHTFPLKKNDRKRHQAWVRFVRMLYEESGSRCQTWNEKEA